MSCEYLYECASDFEQIFLVVEEYVEKNTRNPLKAADFEKIQEMLEKMEHFCNQMDLEANTIKEEELGGIDVHKSCRRNFNSILKQVRDIESRNLKGGAPKRTPYYKGINSTSTTND